MPPSQDWTREAWPSWYRNGWQHLEGCGDRAILDRARFPNPRSGFAADPLGRLDRKLRSVTNSDRLSSQSDRLNTGCAPSLISREHSTNKNNWFGSANTKFSTWPTWTWLFGAFGSLA